MAAKKGLLFVKINLLSFFCPYFLLPPLIFFNKLNLCSHLLFKTESDTNSRTTTRDVNWRPWRPFPYVHTRFILARIGRKRLNREFEVVEEIPWRRGDAIKVPMFSLTHALAALTTIYSLRKRPKASNWALVYLFATFVSSGREKSRFKHCVLKGRS